MLAIKHKLVLLFVVVVVGAAAAAHVDSFNYPAFDATTTQDLVVLINNSAFTPASLLFDDDGGALAKFNRTEGFLLLSRRVDAWRAGPCGKRPTCEASSFNTSFVLSSASPVAFVVLFFQGTGVMVGLNATFIPNGTDAAVWVEYDAAAHRLTEYAAGAGEAKPATALNNLSLFLAGQRATEKAMVGFFASRIHDILVGVRDWNLTVDRFDSSGGAGWKKGTSCSWWMILLAVLGSVAATA